MKKLLKVLIPNGIISYARQLSLRRKGISTDSRSVVNVDTVSTKKNVISRIMNSHLELSTMGYGCYIGNVCTYGDVTLGNHVSISGPGTVLHAAGGGKIVVGNFCSLGQNVAINSFDHHFKRPSTYAMNFFFFTGDFNDDALVKGDVIIEEDVWIGSNSCVVSGVTIGRGSIVAGGSVVTKNVPPYSVVAGVPAKVIKKRFSDDAIKRLEDSRWWEWDEEKIRENKKFFTNELE